MVPLERVLNYYFSVVIVVGGLSLLLSIKYVLRTWRTLQRSNWIPLGLAFGLMALILASLLEAPVLLLRVWVLLALVAGVVEESVKLLPLAFQRASSVWEKWKLVIGTGLFLGLLEGIMYGAAIIVLGQEPYLLGIRAILIGFHTVWAAITAGYLLGTTGARRFVGLAFSMTAHALYDLPPLAILQGFSSQEVILLAALSTAFMLATPLMARESSRKIGESPRGEGAETVISSP